LRPTRSATTIDCAIARLRGREQLRHPRVVVDAVVDHDPRGRDGARDRWAGLEQMRVLVRIAEDAGHAHVGAADLAGDVAVEVLGRDDRDRGVRGLRAGWHGQRQG
jgi:hypothetical protein